jgi:antitoxin VapB
MSTTRLFRNGNSQAVRIPAELAFPSSDMELDIERVGEELRIRPARRRIGRVMETLARFSPDFMQAGRDEQEHAEREAL